jgi:hypothetical protein
MSVARVGSWAGPNGASCTSPKAIAPMAAAAAKPHHQREGSRASASVSSSPAVRGRDATSRCAAARIAASTARDGSSVECARHAASSRGSRSGDG